MFGSIGSTSPRFCIVVLNSITQSSGRLLSILYLNANFPGAGVRAGFRVGIGVGVCVMAAWVAVTTTSVTTSAVTSTMRVTTTGAAGTADAAGAQAASRVASNPVTIPNLTGMKFILQSALLPPPLPSSGCTPGPRPCRPCANHPVTIVLEAEILFTQVMTGLNGPTSRNYTNSTCRH